jgi:hypothetical protein
MTMLSTATDERIDTLRILAETLLDCEELQKFKACLISWSLEHDTLNVLVL